MRDTDWTRFFAVTSLVISSLTAVYAHNQATAAREIPFQAVLYQTRVDAMRDYARAYRRLDNGFRATLVDMPFLVDSPEALNQTLDSQMQENAVVARRFIETHANYIAELSSNMGIWPEAIQKEVANASEQASVAAQCFFQLGARTLKEVSFTEKQVRDYWAEVRQRAAEPCRGLNDKQKIIAFQEASEVAHKRMQDNLRETQRDLVPDSR